MKPEVYMMYMCHLIKHTGRSYLEPAIAAFLKNPFETHRDYLHVKELVTQIRLEMRCLCRRQRWYEGEKEWEKFTINDFINFLIKYDKKLRRRHAKRKTKKSKGNQKGRNSNQGRQEKCA